MDTENESLPTEERTSIEQQTDAIAQVPPQTGNAPLVGQPVTPVPRIQRITPFLEDVRPTPGSNVTRIFGLSDCVIAVAFTLVIVNIRLPPEGLNESQLQSFITHNILSDEIPFYLATYLVVASSWISHYRIFTYLKRSSSLFIILNVLFLASIVFLPVPVAFFYQYGNQTGSLVVFACTQLVTSVTLLLMWVEALVDHLLDPEIPPEYRRYTTARPLLSPPSEGRLPGGNRPHVLDYRQYDRGGNHLPDYHHYGHPPVQQRAIFFDGAVCSTDRIACVWF